MSDVKRERRREALAIFAGWATAAGYPVPSATELDDIAAKPDGYRDRLTSQEAQVWAHTIDELLKQLRMGMYPEPANHGLDDEYRRPSGEILSQSGPTIRPQQVEPNPHPEQSNSHMERETRPPEPPNTETADKSYENAAIEALFTWRERRIAAGDDGVGQIRELTLRNAVKQGWSEEQLARQLAGNAHLAPAIARVIAEHSGTAQHAPSREGAAASSTASSTTEGSQPRHGASPTEPKRTRPEAQQPAQATGPRAGTGAAGVLALRNHDFEPFSHEIPINRNPAPVRARWVGDKVRLTFDPYTAAGKMVVYRVVSGDDVVPYKPESGHLIAATTSLSVDDERPLTCAIRNYQVWCHVGTDLEDARRNQPILLAAGEEVSPVRDFNIFQDEGRVLGEWQVHPKINAVRVFRVRIEDGVDPASIVDDNPADEILTDRDNLRGFVDTDTVPGSRYVYRAMAEATAGQRQRGSRVIQRAIRIAVVLSPVDDLELTTRDGDGGAQFDLLWSDPPIGDVRIYRTRTAPNPSLRELVELEMSALSREEPEFNDENRVKYPPDYVGESKTAITGVPWPSGWDRAYFTPVTYLGTSVRVGATRMETRPLPPVTDADLVERFDTEMVKFSWPKGAVNVWVFVGSPALPPEEICARAKPDYDITKTMHLRDGGHTFTPPLESKGSTVCLVPIGRSGFDSIRGRITSLHYPGLHRMWYSLRPKGIPGRDVRELLLDHKMDLDSSISLVLKYLPDRLPLSEDDGTVISLISPETGEKSAHCVFDKGLRAGPQSTGWSVELTGLQGFVRLFIVMHGDRSKRFALADPSVRELYLPMQHAEPS